MGTTIRDEYLDLFRDAGLEESAMLSEHDYFMGSPSAQICNVAAGFGAVAIVMRASRPVAEPGAAAPLHQFALQGSS